jgi:hypothetical protein
MRTSGTRFGQGVEPEGRPSESHPAASGKAPALVGSASGKAPALVGLLATADAAASAVAAMPWLRAYEVARGPLLLCLAAVLPVLLTLAVSRWLQFSPLPSYAASATGLIVMVAASNSFDFSAVWSGATRVPAQLLTETLPLGGGATLLVPPLVVTWTLSAASAELLLRPARPARAGLAVPVLAFCIAFIATTSAPPGATVVEAAGLFGALVIAGLASHAFSETAAGRAVVASMAAPASSSSRLSSGGEEASGKLPQAWLPWRRTGQRTAHLGSGRSLSRRALAAFAAGAAVAGLAAGLPSLPALSSRPATLSRPTRVLSGTVTDPVDAMAALRANGYLGKAEEIFSVRVSRQWSGYLSVAALDDYDGWGWYFSGIFRPTGGRVPGAPATVEHNTAQPGTSLVVQHYKVARSTGLPFLPVLDRPVQAGGLPVDADAVTGMLASEASPPFSYTVVSRAPYLTATELPAASALASGPAIPGGQDPAYTSLPPGSAKDVAAAVRFAINLTGLPASPSFGFLQDLARALRLHERRIREGALASRRPSGARSSTKGASRGVAPGGALAGTSLAEVINAVTVDHAATPEQFATFFAAVARYLGVPVRLATGFRVPAAGERQQPLGPGLYRLTNTDAWAWDELPVEGYGWVVIDPTPVLTTANFSTPPEQVKPAPPTKPHPATALPSSKATHALARPVVVHPHSGPRVDWAVVFGAGLPGALLVGLLGAFLGAPALRRRLRRLARHQPQDPTLLAAGAWLELLDGLCRLGAQVPGSATSSEVVEDVAERFGEDAAGPASLLASVADQALYSSRQPVEGSQAELAWKCQRDLYRYMRHSLGPRQRARALVRVGNMPARPVAPASHLVAGTNRGRRSARAPGGTGAHNVGGP